MTPEQRRVLEPFGIVISGIQQDLDNKTHDELEAILAACLAVSPTNCWCYTFQASLYLLPDVTARVADGRKREGGSTCLKCTEVGQVWHQSRLVRCSECQGTGIIPATTDVTNNESHPS